VYPAAECITVTQVFRLHFSLSLQGAHLLRKWRVFSLSRNISVPILTHVIIIKDPPMHVIFFKCFIQNYRPNLCMYFAHIIHVTRTILLLNIKHKIVESSWNVMAHGDAREGKWKGNLRMEWVDSTLHTSSEHGVSNITTADAHTSAAYNWLNWRSCRFQWTRPFRQKTKPGFCACAITFQKHSTNNMHITAIWISIYVPWF
jgi:hypothetical protein